VVFASMASHGFLDFASQRPDIPLVPQRQAGFGLGLWDSVAATVGVEGGFWVIAVLLYAGAAHPQGRTGLYGFWGGAALLTAAWWNNIAGQLPAPHLMALAIPSFLFFTVVTAWAYWMDRVRPAVR
jgi:hypothetical protein